MRLTCDMVRVNNVELDIFRFKQIARSFFLMKKRYIPLQYF